MRKLAFLDLDLTLFDYTRVREEATRVALARMNLDCELEEAIDLMNRVLVPYGDILANVGLPNFRREWKAPELFVLLFLMCEGRGLTANAQSLACLFSTFAQAQFVDPAIQFHERKTNYELLSGLVGGPQFEEMISKINEVKKSDPTRTDLNNAINAFHEYLANNAEPLEGVDDLLRNLQSRGFEIYIVSEGQESIQQEKISVLGLREITNGTYVSSSCCDSERLLRWLWSSARIAENKRWLQALEVIYDEVVLYSTKTSSLFRKILHTVLLPDSDRQEFYRKFGWLSTFTSCSSVIDTKRIYSPGLMPLITPSPSGCLPGNTAALINRTLSTNPSCPNLLRQFILLERRRRLLTAFHLSTSCCLDASQRRAQVCRGD